MPNPTQLLGTGSAPAPARAVVTGYISTLQPAPTSFDDPVYVIIPERSIDSPYGPCRWPAIHGSTLPAQGAEALLAFDQAGLPIVVWWDGEQSVDPVDPLVQDGYGTLPAATVAAQTLSTTTAITFPVAYSAMPTVLVASAVFGSFQEALVFSATTITRTGFVVRAFNAYPSSTAAASARFSWIARGTP